MLCNRCGTQLQPEFNLCPQCGNPVAATASVAPARSRLERHLRILGTLWIIIGALWVIPSGVLMFISHRPYIWTDEPMFHHAFMPPLFFSFGAAFLIVAAGGILVGWGLMNHERWARTVAIVFGILALFHPPFFTALGIYTLWALLPADRAAEYSRLSGA
jgi:predicted membrane protein